jgi:PPK2 family polyphosphate:nucleotide phosphotransferase
MGKSEKKTSAEWTMDPRVALRAGEGFELVDFDRHGTPGWEGGKSAGKKLGASRGKLLAELQERLFAEGRTRGTRSVLVIVQGLDTAGKGGVARHVISQVDPQGVVVRSFGVPTEQEAKHHYLWRIRNALPGPGLIGVFDRSHYEDVLVARVDNLVAPSVWQKRYAEINAFEQELVDAGTIVLKFALMVSHDEQGLRLMERLDRPDKHWKFATSDLTTRGKWDAYQGAYQAVFDQTSTDVAPWYVVPADRKWYSRLAITEILAQTLVEMSPSWPKPRWQVAVQRRKLAQRMSTEALAESLAETEDNVAKALEDNAAVERMAIEATVSTSPDSTEDAQAQAALADVSAKRAEHLAVLEETRAQKEALLEARQAAERADDAVEEAAEAAEEAAAFADGEPEPGVVESEPTDADESAGDDSSDDDGEQEEAAAGSDASPQDEWGDKAKSVKTASRKGKSAKGKSGKGESGDAKGKPSKAKSGKGKSGDAKGKPGKTASGKGKKAKPAKKAGTSAKGKK